MLVEIKLLKYIYFTQSTLSLLTVAYVTGNSLLVAMLLSSPSALCQRRGN